MPEIDIAEREDSGLMCPCYNQLQPHARMSTCPPRTPEEDVFETHPQSRACVVQPFDPAACYVWGGDCTACLEDDPSSQHEMTAQEWRDLGGEG